MDNQNELELVIEKDDITDMCYLYEVGNKTKNLLAKGYGMILQTSGNYSFKDDNGTKFHYNRKGILLCSLVRESMRKAIKDDTKPYFE